MQILTPSISPAMWTIRLLQAYDGSLELKAIFTDLFQHQFVESASTYHPHIILAINDFSNLFSHRVCWTNKQMPIPQSEETKNTHWRKQ